MFKNRLRLELRSPLAEPTDGAQQRSARLPRLEMGYKTPSPYSTRWTVTSHYVHAIPFIPF